MKHIKKHNEEFDIPKSGLRGQNVIKSALNYKIYLAGPDVFRKNAISRLNSLKRMTDFHGHSGMVPFDNKIPILPTDTKTQIGSKIFFANVELMDNAQVIIANLDPYRGPGVDDGTAFEIGYGYAKGIRIYGYTTLMDMELKDITTMMFDLEKQKKYSELEDFGNTCNLMISDSIKASGGAIFKTLEECLMHLNQNPI
jgi:nucleoside 2-deoxyribosyltransferase